jgi:hypothetical protein
MDRRYSAHGARMRSRKDSCRCFSVTWFSIALATRQGYFVLYRCNSAKPSLLRKSGARDGVRKGRGPKASSLTL